MREIIHLQFGQCGNQFGTKYWEKISEEHGIDNYGFYQGCSDLQLERIDTCFHEVPGGKFIPRSILVDLESSVLDNIKSSPLGSFFAPDNFLSGQNGAGNNWAKGFYTEGAELADVVLEAARKEAEICDCLQAFQFCHSVGGGTGSGMGTLIMSKLREEYPDKMMCSFTVFPSHKTAEHVVNAYVRFAKYLLISQNSVLALHQLIENADQVFVFDNVQLEDICFETLHVPNVQYHHINQLASSVMSGATASLRSSGQLNSDFRRLATNLIPFPRVHFFLLSHAPLALPSSSFRYNTEGDLLHGIFNHNNVMANVDPSNGKYIAAAATFRGQISAMEVSVTSSCSPRSRQFIEWIPGNLQVAVCNLPPTDVHRSATLISNSTSIQDLFKKEVNSFHAMFRRKAFLHWYIGEGMDEMEFTEADQNVNDLLCDYQQYQGAESDPTSEQVPK